MNDIPLSIVINYFNPSRLRRIEAMTELALEHLSSFTQLRHEIIVADGSGVSGEWLRDLCAHRGWIYAPSEARESFARSYNRGASLAKGDYIVWMANDILVQSDWDTLLIRELERTSAWMAAPYLSYSDYWVQTRGRAIRNSTFHPSFFTFNLNLMTRRCWETVGPIDERFSGCFNDLDYLIRIRAAGGDAVIAEAGNITHIGKATLQLGTDVNNTLDAERFNAKYPDFRRNCQLIGTDPILCHSKIYRTLLALTWKFPAGTATTLLREMLCRFEPLFHRYRKTRKPEIPKTALAQRSHV